MHTPSCKHARSGCVPGNSAVASKAGLLLRGWLACWLLFGIPTAFAEDVLLLSQGEFTDVASATPPPDDAGWRPQSLPDQWRRSRPGVTGDGWYRMQFELAATPSEGWAIYLPRLCMNAAVYVNGVPLGDGGRFEEPVARNWNRPLLFTLPAALLHAGTNIVHVRLQTFAMVQGSLSPLEVGPARLLQPQYQTAFFERVTVNQALTVVIAMVGVLMLSLWWRRRRDSMYGYFGASALVWSVNSTNLHLQYAPLSTRNWEILINATFQIFIPLLLVSLMRFLGKRNRKLESLLWLIAVAAPVTMLLMPDTLLLTVFSSWHFLTLIGGIATLFVLVPAALRDRSSESRLLLGGLLVNLVFGVHDWLVHSKMLPPLLGAETRIHLLHYGAPVFFLIVGWIMTSRFVGALNRLEGMNEELEQRVEAKSAELHANFQHLQVLRSEQAVHEERERIYRDLHDDIGAKLLQMVYRAGNANDAELARSALQDLRDVVSHPGGSQLTMEDMLADWRAETDQRLGAANLRLDWQQPEHVSADFLQPHAINLGRILREAISNVIRHAKATHVKVSVDQASGDFRLVVSDNGNGYDPTRSAQGRGVSNMQQRARRIGGAIRWMPSEDGGCRVELTVPSPATAASLTPA